MVLMANQSSALTVPGPIWRPGKAEAGVESCIDMLRESLASSRPQVRSEDAGKHFQQAIRRWGNSLAVRLPADCLRQAGLREGDPIEIVVGPDGRLSLEPLRQMDRAALAADLRELQTTMPLTPSVMEDCRAGERW